MLTIQVTHGSIAPQGAWLVGPLVWREKGILQGNAYL